MKKAFPTLASAAALALVSVAGAQTYVGSIDISTQIGAANGIHAAHMAVDSTGANPILYVNSLNNSGAARNTPTLKITDPLGTPVITTIDVNDAGGAGAASTRGSGGVAVDGAGNVFVAWTGNGGDDTARVRRYDTAGTLTGEWLHNSGLSDRPGGIDANAAGTGFVVSRFLSTATKVTHIQITGTNTLTRTFSATPTGATALNPRDIAFDATNSKLYINANGNLEVITAGTTPSDLYPETNWLAANGATAATLQTTDNNSFAGHGVCLNADGSLIGYTPSQNVGFGQNTFRIVDSTGTTVYTIGTLGSAGDGTGALLRRPSDGVFFTSGGRDYIAIGDYSLPVSGVSDFSRVAIYDITPPATYTWDGGATGSWAVAANWDPDRAAPAADDTLIFDSSATVTSMPNETVGSLLIQNNAAVVIDGGGAGTTLSIGGGTDALQIEAGSSLTLTGGGGAAGSLVVDVLAGSTATISGDLIFNSTEASTAHRLNANAASQVIFADGATAAMAAVSTGAGGGFGSGTQGFDGGVIFQSGSAYYQGGLKDGTRTGGTGSNPFARTQPAANVVFESGSSYVNLGGIPASTGRTYANFIWRDGYGATRNFGGATLLTILNDVQIIEPGGTMANASTPSPGIINNTQVFADFNGNFLVAAAGAQFQDNYDSVSVAGILNFKGDFTVENAGRFRAATTANGQANRFYVFDGTSNQTIDVNGTVLTRVEINNPAGVTVASPLGVLTALTMTNGAITATGKGGLALGTGVSAPVGYAGPVGSAAYFNAAATGVVSTDIGVELNITTAGAGTGRLCVLPLQGAATGLPGGLDGAARTWFIEVSHAGAITADLTIPYTPADITGLEETGLLLARFNGTTWEDVPATVDTVNKTITATGVTQFSEWTIYGPDESSSVPVWNELDD